ncbi:CU044_2847 family protein [Fimbriiglobus ruber]|uniref:CU044_2847 family protein n=1 Tax=Fimbriiglobus ruber TaxID=1908690 RepID=UPI000B4AF9E0|nr:CU044_2847 family protein [Fimbriiglobus ruber]
MTKIIEFLNEDGTTVLIEVKEPEDAQRGTGRASRSETVHKLGQKAFEAGLAHLRPIAQAVMKTATELNNPSEVAIEFGIKVSVESGVIVASAEAEANFKVSLKWKNSKTEGQ